MSHVQQSLEQNMYTPMLVSVQDALEKVGATTRIVDWHSDLEMLEGVRKAVAKNKRPLVVNVAIRFGTKKAMRALQACRQAGAYLVLYSTEAADAEWMSGAAANLSAHEVWEYALSNIDRYSEEFRRRTPVRYMPPGYSPRLDAGVDLRSDSKMRATASRAQRAELSEKVNSSPTRQVDSAGFLGGFGYRPGAIKMLYRSMLGARLTLPGDVWTQEQQQKYLSKFPLQLNIHKEQSCCPHDPDEPVAMEAFRMAVLLTNRACVLSTPVPEKDRRLWEGIVHFAEPDKTLQALNLLRGDVLGCQERAASLFRRRFDPLKLMRDSGFLEVWRPSGL